jgi:hypothetical protein
MGIGGFLSDTFGGSNDYQSQIKGPDPSLFQSPDQQANKNMLQGALGSSQGAAPIAQAASGPNVALNDQYQSRGMQMNLANQLAQQAVGQGPSLAGQQLQQGLQQQLLQQRAQAASMGGDVNPFLAQRQLADQGAQAQQATNAQMAMARTQEQMNAQGALGGLTGQLRGQDLGNIGQQQQYGIQNAQLQQQANLANQGANLQQQNINNQASQYAMSGLLGLSSQQMQGNLAYAGMDQQSQLARDQINAGVAQGNAASAGKYGGAVFGGLMQGAAALASDERLKTNIDRGHVDAEMRDFLTALDPASYDYKQASHGEGRHWSVMAQSAAKSAAGRSFVQETPEGLALDTRKATGVALAALSHLHRRQDKLETLAQKALRRG